MAEPDKTFWRRILALPNESRAKTILVAFLVSAACAALVSGATVMLRPIQAANRAAEEQARIEALGLDLLPPRPRVEGEGRSLYFYGPDNHLFELHTGTLEERLARYAKGRQGEGG